MLEEQWIEGKWTCLRNSGSRVSGHVLRSDQSHCSVSRGRCPYFKFFN